jgi:hypothetical protein
MYLGYVDFNTFCFKLKLYISWLIQIYHYDLT